MSRQKFSLLHKIQVPICKGNCPRLKAGLRYIAVSLLGMTVVRSIPPVLDAYSVDLGFCLSGYVSC